MATTFNLPYTFSTSVVEPPTGSQLRLDAAFPYTAAAKVWVRTLTNEGVDAFAALMAVPVWSTLYVQDKDDHTAYVRFTTTAAPVDRTSYVEFAVIWEANGIALTNNKAVQLVASPPSVTPSPPPSGGSGRTAWPVPTAPHAGALAVVVLVKSAPIFTRVEAKTRAALDWVDGDPRDAMIDGFVLSAQRAIETETGLVPLLQQIECYLSAFPAGGGALLLPRRPVVSVDEVTWTDGSGVIQHIDPTTLVLDPGTAQTPAWLAVAAGGSWPTGGASFPPSMVRLTVGYADIAALQVAAPELLDAAGVHIAHAANAGRDRFTDANRRDEFCALLNPYQLVTVP